MSYRYPGNGASLVLDQDKCIGCGRCTEVCPHAVFELHGKKAVMVDRGACMECGACAKNCLVKAITVKAGVGCVAAILQGMVKGTAPTCGCDGNETKGGCC
jgi:NAD-dependent dihydropyrimidine dehydrogenase PreA subunit